MALSRESSPERLREQDAATQGDHGGSRPARASIESTALVDCPSAAEAVPDSVNAGDDQAEKRKAGRSRSAEILEEDQNPTRCKRTDGQKWRCKYTVIGGTRYCEKHTRWCEGRRKKGRENGSDKFASRGDSASLKLETGADDEHVAQLKQHVLPGARPLLVPLMVPPGAAGAAWPGMGAGPPAPQLIWGPALGRPGGPGMDAWVQMAAAGAASPYSASMDSRLPSALPPAGPLPPPAARPGSGPSGLPVPPMGSLSTGADGMHPPPPGGMGVPMQAYALPGMMPMPPGPIPLGMSMGPMSMPVPMAPPGAWSDSVLMAAGYNMAAAAGDARYMLPGSPWGPPPPPLGPSMVDVSRGWPPMGMGRYGGAGGNIMGGPPPGTSAGTGWPPGSAGGSEAPAPGAENAANGHAGGLPGNVGRGPAPNQPFGAAGYPGGAFGSSGGGGPAGPGSSPRHEGSVGGASSDGKSQGPGGVTGASAGGYGALTREQAQALGMGGPDTAGFFMAGAGGAAQGQGQGQGRGVVALSAAAGQNTQPVGGGSAPRQPLEGEDRRNAPAAGGDASFLGLRLGLESSSGGGGGGDPSTTTGGGAGGGTRLSLSVGGPPGGPSMPGGGTGAPGGPESMAMWDQLRAWQAFGAAGGLDNNSGHANHMGMAGLGNGAGGAAAGINLGLSMAPNGVPGAPPGMHPGLLPPGLMPGAAGGGHRLPGGGSAPIPGLPPDLSHALQRAAAMSGPTSAAAAAAAAAAAYSNDPQGLRVKSWPGMEGVGASSIAAGSIPGMGYAPGGGWPDQGPYAGMVMARAGGERRPTLPGRVRSITRGVPSDGRMHARGGLLEYSLSRRPAVFRDDSWRMPASTGFCLVGSEQVLPSIAAKFPGSPHPAAWR
eukprot:jgi/Mesvir1/16846/Mv15737-RA.1